MSLIDNSQRLISQVVYDYLKFYFTPVKMKGKESYQYMYENALHLNLGRNVDHLSYILFLARQYPYCGVVVKDARTLKAIKRADVKRGDRTLVPKSVTHSFQTLPKPVELLIIYEATKLSARRLGRTLVNWTTEKPLILLG